MQSTRYSSPILAELVISNQISEKYSNNIFRKNPSGERRVVCHADKQSYVPTDMTILIFVDRNFANAFAQLF